MRGLTKNYMCPQTFDRMDFYESESAKDCRQFHVLVLFSIFFSKVFKAHCQSVLQESETILYSHLNFPSCVWLLPPGCLETCLNCVLILQLVFLNLSSKILANFRARSTVTLCNGIHCDALHNFIKKNDSQNCIFCKNVWLHCTELLNS